MLGKIWDDTLGGPQPDSGLSKLRKNSTFNATHRSAGEGNRVIGKPPKFQRSLSMESRSATTAPSSPTAPSSSSASSTPRDRENVWRSVFDPGSNINTKSVGSQKFDKAEEAKSPTVYDWLYKGETRSKWR